MSKIICEICGTSYPDTASACPICGWEKNGKNAASVAEDELDLNFLNEDSVTTESSVESDPVEAPTVVESVRVPQRASASSEKAIFDYDAVNAEKPIKVSEPEDEEEEEEDEEEEESRPNTFLIIILVILIVALLATSGYIFWKYYLPSRNAAESVPTDAVTAEVVEPTQTEEPVVPAVPTVPCTGLSLVSGMEKLSYEGQNWLLHIKASPEDTTDEIQFVSEDESIATVNAEGRVTAVAEGETRIIITCGSQRIECPVVVSYEEEPETTEAAETEETTAATEATEEPAQTEAPSTDETKPGVVLKLKKTDITFGIRGVYVTLQLDCDLKPEEITWSTRDPSVATVKNGDVTAVGPGLTVITAKYGDQTVECIVRCNF